ncbi:MAG: tetratricopeptide repeat protein, partial [Synechococcales bacterium]|nr:tetratricopeptide repeat protein [Synechococcales bacterium]
AAFQQAIHLAPSSPGAHDGMGRAQMKKGQLDEAIAALQKALELKPDHAPSQELLQKALAQKN